jgi:hypothetical protein
VTIFPCNHSCCIVCELKTGLTFNYPSWSLNSETTLPLHSSTCIYNLMRETSVCIFGIINIVQIKDIHGEIGIRTNISFLSSFLVFLLPCSDSAGLVLIRMMDWLEPTVMQDSGCTNTLWSACLQRHILFNWGKMQLLCVTKCTLQRFGYVHVYMCVCACFKQNYVQFKNNILSMYIFWKHLFLCTAFLWWFTTCFLHRVRQL